MTDFTNMIHSLHGALVTSIADEQGEPQGFGEDTWVRMTPPLEPSNPARSLSEAVVLHICREAEATGISAHSDGVRARLHLDEKIDASLLEDILVDAVSDGVIRLQGRRGGTWPLTLQKAGIEIATERGWFIHPAATSLVTSRPAADAKQTSTTTGSTENETMDKAINEMTVKSARKAIAKLGTIQDVEAALLDEQKGKARVTILSALNTRKETLGNEESAKDKAIRLALEAEASSSKAETTPEVEKTPQGDAETGTTDDSEAAPYAAPAVVAAVVAAVEAVESPDPLTLAQVKELSQRMSQRMLDEGCEDDLLLELVEGVLALPEKQKRTPSRRAPAEGTEAIGDLATGSWFTLPNGALCYLSKQTQNWSVFYQMKDDGEWKRTDRQHHSRVVPAKEPSDKIKGTLPASA